MKTLAFVRLCVFLLLIILQIFAQSEDENSIRKVVADYQDAIVKGEFDSLKTFSRFNNNSDAIEIAKIKSDFQRFPLKSLVIRSIDFQNQNAVVRCFYERINPANKQSASGPSLNHEFLILSKTADGWKITNRYTAELDITNRLLEAKTFEDRKRIIQNEKEVRTQPVIFGVVGQLGGIGNYELSEEFLTLAEWFGEEFFKTNPQAKANNTFNVMNNRAINQRRQGNYAEAIRIYDEASGVAERFKLKGVGLTYINKGILYFKLGNIDLAEFYAKAAQEMFKDSDPARQGAVFSSLYGLFTDIYISKGDYKSALEMIDQKKEAFSNARGLVNFRNGNLEESLKDFQNVIDNVERAVVRNEIRSVSEACEAYIQTAEINLVKNEFEKALVAAEKAQNLAEKLKSQEDIFRAFAVKGKILLRVNRLEEAEKNLQTAIENIESFRKKSTAFSDSQIGLLEENISPYLELAKLYFSRGEFAKVFDISERTKSRVLNDVLSGSKIDRASLMSEAEQKHGLEARQRINDLNLAILKENYQPTKNQSYKIKLQDDLNSARRYYELFQDAVLAKYPKLNFNIGSSEAITVEKIDRKIISQKDAVIEYLTVGDRIFVFVFTKKSNQDLNLQAYEIAEAEKVFEQIGKFNERIRNKDLDFQTEAKTLFSKLIQPFQKDIIGKSNLVIVPDNKLWNLSFASLIDSENRFLVEKYSISYAPSITALQQLSNRKSDVPVDINGVFAIGNPQVSELITKNVQGQYRSNFENLPDAEIEAQQIKKLYGKSSKVLIRSEATESIFKNEVGKYRILHLATHGIANSLNPAYSHLLLTSGKGDDGLLEAWEIMNLKLNADLVVLSACETNSGKISSGEGIVGLSWAFFIAGTPRIVATQWKVESASTALIMQNFHRNFSKSRDVAKSLQTAMLGQIRNPKTKHPFYWAGFVSIGKN